LLGTFAEHTVVNEASCVKIQPDWPLDKACLLGCGVVTGWGSAVYAADVQPGEYVAVVGVGGDRPRMTADGLFLPGAVEQVGPYLMVGEFKFSNRVLGFPLS